MMNKKDLKMYEAPACEVVELESKIVLLAGSGEEEPGEDEGQGTNPWH